MPRKTIELLPAIARASKTCALFHGESNAIKRAMRL
jgi:hypothetical protein